MDVQVAQLSPVLVEYSVTVEIDRVKKAMDKAFVELQKSARVKGFRPGKAPREVLSHLYGQGVASEVRSKLIGETLNEVLRDRSVQPLSEPKVDVVQANASILTYKARFEVRPEVANLKWEGLEAEKPKRALTDEQVEAALEQLRKQHAALVVPEVARPAQTGDEVSIDFVAKVDGKEIDSGKGVSSSLGDGKLVKELEDAILGANIGETKHAHVHFPENHTNPGLRGKVAHFDVTLLDVKERKLPTLDDEFAKDVGEFENLDAVRTDIRAKLGKQLEDDAEQTLVTNLVAALCNANPIEAPPSLVQQQMQLTFNELRAQSRRAGRDLQLNTELERQLRVDSEVKVRAGLLMAEIARLSGVMINDADIENGLKELAEESGKNVAKLRVEYRDEQKRQMLIGMILEDKVLDLLIGKAQVKEVEVSA